MPRLPSLLAAGVADYILKPLYELILLAAVIAASHKMPPISLDGRPPAKPSPAD